MYLSYKESIIRLAKNNEKHANKIKYFQFTKFLSSFTLEKGFKFFLPCSQFACWFIIKWE